ncbi:MAG TPA: hypothetical protein VFO41_03740 [Alphaproteobacteria bacterium]|nr:hypothetical protein [Alphaproteobacteria bacterium]
MLRRQKSAEQLVADVEARVRPTMAKTFGISDGEIAEAYEGRISAVDFDTVVVLFRAARAGAGRERHAFYNSCAAFGAALICGYAYAQLARAMGTPPALIGPIAIGIETAVFICGHAARLGEHLARLFRRRG